MSVPSRTRDRLLEVSLELFNEHGFANTTTARIAESAGVAEGNLWYHYPEERMPEVFRTPEERSADWKDHW